ncbi:MAG: radical SAM protein [Candidatus Aenigmatarchaeota archaeon]
MKPSYRQLSENRLAEKYRSLRDRLESCDLCGHGCGVNRFEGEEGLCDSSDTLKINSASRHFGEEDPLVGDNGSGTVFVSNCNMSCVYCQNWRISQEGRGRGVTEDRAAEMMLELQDKGCHNINWVSPTHHVPQLVGSLLKARKRGLKVPIVYNTGGYDNPEVIETLGGIVDIYMPDVKYGSNANGEKYSNVDGYWDVVTENLKEMHGQVGDLEKDGRGIAKQGLLIRHLVLPGNISEPRRVLKFIKNEISENSYVNIMGQYRPDYRADDYKKLGRRVRRQEVEDVKEMAEDMGLSRGFQ